MIKKSWDDFNLLCRHVEWRLGWGPYPGEVAPRHLAAAGLWGVVIFTLGGLTAALVRALQ